MVGPMQIHASGVALLLVTIALLPVGGASETLQCTAATGFMDDSDAECLLSLGTCSESCITYELTITVTADTGTAGLLTPHVTGYIAGTIFCSGLGSCTGSTTLPQASPTIGISIPCEGSGLEGRKGDHTLTALSTVCTRTPV